MNDNFEGRIERMKHFLISGVNRSALINSGKYTGEYLKLDAPVFENMFNMLAAEKQELSFSRTLETDKNISAEALASVLEKLSGEALSFYGVISIRESSSAVNEKLRKLYERAEAAAGECPAGCLYMCFGMLRWRCEAFGGEWFSSPLILLPIEFADNTPEKPFCVRSSGAEIILNPALQFCMKNIEKTDFPQFDRKYEKCLSEYVEDVRKKAAEKGWRVSKDVYLNVFKPSDLFLAQSLLSSENAIIKSRIIRALSEKREVAYSPSEQPKDMEEAAIFSSDEYQKNAVQLALNGQSFVLDGARDTGKTQAAVNIAGCEMYNGKKVLYITSDTESVKDVYERFREAGLNDFCLPVYYNKKDGETMISRMAASLTAKNKKTAGQYECDVEVRKTLEENYQAYLCEMKSSNNFGGIPTYEIAGNFMEYSGQPFTVPPEVTGDYPFNVFNELTAQISEYEKKLSAVDGNIKDCCWTDVRTIDTGEEELFGIRNLFARTAETAAEIMEIYSAVQKISGLKEQPGKEELRIAAEKIKLFSKMPDVPEKWISINMEELPELREKACEMREISDRMQKYKTASLKYFSSGIFSIDIAAWKKKLYSLSEEINSLPTAEKQETPLLLENIDFHIIEADNAVRELNNYSLKINELNNYLGTSFIDAPETVWRIEDFIKLIEEPFAMPEGCFTRKNLKAARELLAKIRNAEEERQNIIKKIGENWSDSILALDAAAEKTAWSEICGKVEKIVIFDSETAAAYCNSEEKQAELEDAADEFENAINELEKFTEEYKIFKETEEDAPVDFEVYHKTEKLIEETEKINFTIPDAWLKEDTRKAAYELAVEADEKSERAAQIKQKLEAQWRSEIFELNPAIMLKEYDDHPNDLKAQNKIFREHRKLYKKLILQTLRGFTVEQERLLLEELKEYNEINGWFTKNEQNMKALYGIHFSGSVSADSTSKGGNSTDWKDLKSSIEKINMLFDAADSEKSELIAAFAEKFVLNAAETAKVKSDIFGIKNMEGYLIRQKADFEKYKTGTPLKELAEELRRTLESMRKSYSYRKKLKELYLNKDEFKEENISELFDMLFNLSECMEKYNKGKELSAVYFGKDFDIDINDTEIDFAFEKTEKLIEYFNGYVPENIIKFAAEGKTEECVREAKRLNSAAARFAEKADEIIKDEYVFTEFDKKSASENAETITAIRDKFIDFKMHYKIISSLYLRGRADFRRINENLNAVEKYRTESDNYKQKIEIYKDVFGEQFESYETNWKSVVQSIDRLKELKLLLTEDEMKAVNGKGKEFAEAEEKFEIIKDSFEKDIQWCSEKFEAGAFEKLTFSEIAEKLKKCADNTEGLQPWLDYCHSRKVCREKGLNSVIEYAERNNIRQGLTEGFKKAYYARLFSRIVTGSSVLPRTGSEKLNRMSAEIQAMEENYICWSRNAVLQKLRQNLPSQNGLISADDEMALLTGELCRKKDKMSEEKLFTAIPGLIQRMKPCLIMTAEAALYYMHDAIDKYKFDIAIIDNAERISTGNSLFPLSFAEQTVIAGDSAYVKDKKRGHSILKAAMDTFPEIILKSYHGNAEEYVMNPIKQLIYPDRLDLPPDLHAHGSNGVKYYYVGTDIFAVSYFANAAEKCRLIYEEMKENAENNSTVGIIVFGSRMKTTVEQCLERSGYCAGKNKYTVIAANEISGAQKSFSSIIICTGVYSETGFIKDAENDILMSREGGLLIADAMQLSEGKIAVVGGISKNEILNYNGGFNGISMLKEYFAAETAEKLKPEMPGKVKLYKAVSDFLQDSGYHTSYKDDIIYVSKQEQAEAYAVLEADIGALENLAQRRDMFEKAGFAYYMISCTAWILNEESEKKALLSFLRYGNKLTGKKNKGKTQFAEYEITDIDTFFRSSSEKGGGNLERLAECILYVLQHEQPISKSLLFRRLLPAFREGSAPEKIMKTIDKAISLKLKNEIHVDTDSFIWLPQKPLEARVPRQGDEPRPIEMICEEEISLAMKKILESEGGMSVQQLISECAAVFKCIPTRAADEQRLSSAFGSLIKEGQVRIVGGEVYINRGEYL